MDAAAAHREVRAIQRDGAAVAFRHAGHLKERLLLVLPHASSPFASQIQPDYWLPWLCFMISCAEKLMPQVGNELPTKKLSDSSGK